MAGIASTSERYRIAGLAALPVDRAGVRHVDDEPLDLARAAERVP